MQESLHSFPAVVVIILNKYITYNTFYFLVEISILSFLTEIYYYLYAKYSDKLHIPKRK